MALLLNLSVNGEREIDERLVLGLRDGSEEAYERLILRFQQPVYNLAFRLLNDTGDASDVVQEVFLKVFRNIGRFHARSSLKTWIYRITVNEAHNQRRWFFRHRSREVCLDGYEEDRTAIQVAAASERSPFDQACNEERHELIEEALTRINPAFRAAVVLRDIEDMSYEEIGEVLALSPGTVKSRILRGREALRQELSRRLDPGRALQLDPQAG